MDQFVFNQFQKMIEATMQVGEQSNDAIQEAAQSLSTALLNGKRVFTVGDGAGQTLSALAYNYLCAGLSFERPGFPAIDLNKLALTERGADRYSEFLQLQAQDGDCLLMISSGNNDLGLLTALEYATGNQIQIILLSNQNDPLLQDSLGYNDVLVNLGELEGPLLHQAQLQSLQCICAAIDKIVFGAE